LNLFGLRVRSRNKYARFSPEFFVSEEKADKLEKLVAEQNSEVKETKNEQQYR